MKRPFKTKRAGTKMSLPGEEVWEEVTKIRKGRGAGALAVVDS